MKKNRNRTGSVAFFVAAVILFMGAASSASVLFSRMVSYSETKFVNVMPLLKTESESDVYSGVKYPGAEDTEPPADSAKPSDPALSGPSGAAPAETAVSGSSSATNVPPVNNDEADNGGNSSDGGTSNGGTDVAARPEFRMEAEVEIFKFSYDNESGKITVIGPAGNEDKLIAPGTTNLYQFTLRNSGNVSLDYTLTMEAYVTGTDLRIPVNARVWDYKNKYLVGSQTEMPDVMELNTVNESAELGPGRYAVYTLEWEWPFERADENGDITLGDEYDTMLGNLAVDQDLVLHIVIRTIAEYDENPDDPNAGETKPPKTGDSAPVLAMALICGFSLLGFLAMFFVVLKSGRKDKEKKAV